MIAIRRIGEGDPFEFEAVISDGRGESVHRVTVSKDTYERLTGSKYPPEALLDAAFRFLLDREPKEAILRRFDVTVISRYFPDFEQKLSQYLSST
jgi:hypothetical protein